MILKASHHPVIYPFFQLYSFLKIRWNFREVNIIHDFRDKGLPILIISNHISWWDGFWVVYLNLKLLHRKYFSS
jgi:1-acyl-sn-glycerol-3-phosphate acyltransferase